MATTNPDAEMELANKQADVYPMFPSGKFIKDGDIVIMQLTRESLVPITIKAGEQTQNRFGRYMHSDLIGVPYGSKVPASNNKGFVYLLRPTPELWTLSLPHRTQILYIADIAYILSELGIRPGSTVIEAGTGSGSFSHSVARAISPSGKLHSFEFHQTRAEKAKVEFEEHGMNSLVKLRHRNVCKDGFDLEGEVDAVFLDLPAPWEAVKSAKLAMRTDRITRICCYSPCIEQVLRTVTALSKEGFSDISMSETLLRPHSVETQISLPPIGTAMTKLRAVEAQKETRRQTQKINSSNKNAALKRKAKGNGGDDDGEEEVDEEEEGPVEKGKGKGKEKKEQEPRRKKGDPIPYGVTVSKPNSEVRGHTSYLTFATLLPIGLRPDTKEEGAREGDDFAGDDTMGAVLAGLTEEELEVMLGSAAGGAAALESEKAKDL